MPSELNRRALFAAAASFLVALAVAYALSSTGQASEGSGPPGSPAEPLDVVSGEEGSKPTLGDAEALPALVVVKPKPKPKPEPKAEPTPVDTPAPEEPAPPVIVNPQPQTPTVTPPAPPPPADPPVEFEDSG
jgi:hypothetical protein